MLNYEVMRMSCGWGYDREAALHHAIRNLMRDALPGDRTEADPAFWDLFIHHLREEIQSRVINGKIHYSVVLRMHFATPAEIIYFKMAYGDRLTSKVLPDKHFHENGVGPLSHGEGDTV